MPQNAEVLGWSRFVFRCHRSKLMRTCVCEREREREREIKSVTIRKAPTTIYHNIKY